MDHEPFEQCLQAFVRRDYLIAARSALGILKEGAGLGMAQILLISTRRMGMSPSEALTQAVYAAAAGPWQCALMDVTMGRRDPTEVMAEADGVLQQCQALCYAGAHLITTGDLDAGRRLLRQCLDLDVECMETQIALMDTVLVDRWSGAAPEADQEVERLRNTFHYLRSTDGHQQSIHIADLVLALVVGHHGDYHPETARSLNDLATAYLATGDFARAEPLLTSALHQALLFDGASGQSYAVVLDNLGQAKMGQEQNERAEWLFRQALAAFAEAVGAEHPSYATCLGHLALVCANLGKHAEAERCYQEAVELRRRLLGTDDPRYIAMVDGLVEFFQGRGRLDAAEPLVTEIAEIVSRMKGADSLEYGARLKQLGALYHRLGRYSDSAEQYRLALVVDHHRLGFDDPVALDTAAKLAVSHKLAGRLGEALRGYQYLVGRQSGADLAITKLNYAKLLLDTGSTHLARRYAQEAVELHRSAGLQDSLEHALMLTAAASVDAHDERYDDAERSLRQAMDLIEHHAGRDNEHYAQACTALANCRFEQRRYDDADELLQTGLRLTEEALGYHAPAVAAIVGMRAKVRLAKGQWDGAERLFRRALELMGEDTGTERRQTAHAELLEGLASALVATGRERDAIEVLLTAERHRDGLLQERSMVAGVHAVVIHQPAALLNILGRPGLQSPALLSRLLEIVWRRKGIVAEAEFVRRREEIHTGQHDGDDVRSRLDALAQTIESGEMPEPARIGEVADAYARNMRSGMYPRLQQAHRELHAHMMEGRPEQGDLSQEEWKERIIAYVARAGSLMGIRDQLESEVRTLFPGDGWLAEVLPRVTLEAVRSRLPEGAALVEFLCVPTLDGTAVEAEGGSRWGPTRYYAFVVTPDRDEDVRLMDLGPADRVDADIAVLRRAITRGGRARDIDPERTPAEEEAAGAADKAAADLRKALLDPLGIDDLTQWYVAPDGQLYTLPFEVLPLDDGRLVIDAREIAYLTTGRDLTPAQRSVPEPAGPPVVIADPDYDLALALDATTDRHPPEGDTDRRRAAGLRFARLPGTHDEGRHVAALLGVEAWLGADAIEGPLKQQRSPVVLHIASHGYFLDDDRPPEGRVRQSDGRALRAFPAPLLNSGLALAGANTWLRRGPLPELAEDGLLTAADLATMDLSGTELVVLSACDTGRGQVSVGQGVYGLRRSVGIAGARTLVMSLWQVPDRETQELMEDFYSRLKGGEPRGAAFRAARLAMRARRPDPYYWGAFICQGDPGPMPAGFLGGVKPREPLGRVGNA
ncbi:CHAT domain-containing protein [Streptomyces sp. NPDC059835]|uniref:CHAT domain-containing protein n=1 Tax=Streptomyces sp. NPDC059835 TaxID=3346967 RepID=UPI003652269F